MHLWALVPFVDNATVAAVRALDDSLDAFAVGGELGHPRFRLTEKLRKLVAAARLLDLSQKAERDLGGVPAFGVGGGEDSVFSSQKSGCIHGKDSKVGVFERGRILLQWIQKPAAV
jgi:hypothetical protein